MWIRPIQKDDLHEVMELDARSYSDAWTADMWKDTYEHDYDFTYIIEEDAKVIGSINFRILQGEAELMRITVDESARGRKLSELMMDRMMNHLQYMNVSKVTLEVRSQNDIAIHLYEKYGFETISTRPNYYNNPTDDAAIMQLMMKG